jgi:protein involved in polysaccharide export with SLBB domain
MHTHLEGFCDRPRGARGGRLALVLWIAALVVGALPGCTAITNPAANGLPVRLLPPELLAESKKDLVALPLTLLSQKPPEQYRLASGDVLGVWIEGVYGEKEKVPPTHFPENASLLPSVGLPVLVRDDGTIPLPYLPPLPVAGKTIEETQEVVRKAYIEKDILKPGRERIIVTLQRRREYHVLVIRQDAGTSTAPAGTGGGGGRSVGFSLTAGGATYSLRRGAGFAVDLPAYENDILNALARTGGLPGLEAVNEVIIYRGSFKGDAQREALLHAIQALPAGCNSLASLGLEGTVIRIPLRVRKGEHIDIRPEDVILQTGDIVFIEAREADLFYVGGLLPSSEYVLPRDYDLDVFQAVMRVAGPLLSGGINSFNVNGNLGTTFGFGFPSPSLLTVLRRTADGGQVNIRVDLNKAMRDPRERILVQAGDVLLLQETPDEAFGRYLSQTFRLNYLYTFINNKHAFVTSNASVP